MSGSVMPLLALEVSPQSRANGGEGGGEVSECPRKCHSYMAYEEGDELHASPMFREGREEGSVLRGLGLEFGFASKIST